MTTTAFARAVEERRAALKAAERRLADAGARFLMVHVAEMSGQFRTKITPLSFCTEGEALNAMLLGTAHADGAPVDAPLFPSEIAGEAQGYPNIIALADPASIRHHTWDSRFASVILDPFMRDGTRCPIDPRAALAAQQARAEAMGFEARFGLEFEFAIFRADAEKIRAGRFGELEPWGIGATNYDIARSAEYAPFFAELMDRLAALDIGVASVVTEYGNGLYELALAPRTPLRAADDALRMKLHLRALCAERGLVPTFMPRVLPPGRESGCGLHHSQSLWRDGRNVFGDGAVALSEIARHYLAGLLRHMAECHVLFRPTINAHRRMERAAWSPEEVGWAEESRLAAIRAITGPHPEAVRLEHRVPGPDANPYLAIAAMLGAGLDGIEARARPEQTERMPLARALPHSIAAWRASAFARRIFGPALHAHYAASRQAEQDAFETWLAGHITDFEFRRYFLSA